VNAKHLTVRGVPVPLAKALVAERRRTNKSMNQTAIDALARGLGVPLEEPRPNGLEKLAGTWTKKEADRFEKAVRAFEQIDNELWR
jgi:hypothetical protein